MCILWGKKKDLSYGGGGLLKLCINQKACFRLVAQESIKKTAVHPFLLLPFKQCFDFLGRDASSSCSRGLKAELANINTGWASSTKGGILSRIKEQENPGKKMLQFWAKNLVFKLAKKKVSLNLSYWSSYSFVPYPCLVCYLKPFRRAGWWSGHLKESWAAVLSPFPHKNARK